MDVDLRDAAGKKHGGSFNVERVIRRRGEVTVMLKPTVEPLGSSEQYYVRSWKEASITLPLEVIPQLVEALAADWQEVCKELWEIKHPPQNWRGLLKPKEKIDQS
jgi:hypothetical protein